MIISASSFTIDSSVAHHVGRGGDEHALSGRSASAAHSRPGDDGRLGNGDVTSLGCTALVMMSVTMPATMSVRMFLNGTAMSGGADHHLVGDSALLASTTTAPRYRFHAVDGRYPALEDVGPGGVAVHGEVYQMDYAQLREVLLPGEPDGLELGVIELADGSGALAMVLRREYPASPPLTDISALASWRAYVDQQ